MIMGNITTPRYRLEVGGYINCTEMPSAWKGRLPTVAALERHVMAGVVSTMPGFVNEHSGKVYGIQIPSYARVRENKRGGRVMVEWKAPMFTVLPDPADYPEVAKALQDPE